MGSCILFGRVSFLLRATALVLVSACGSGSDSDPIACTASHEAGIRIQVTDSASGNPISCGAHAVVTAGTYSEAVDNLPGSNCSNTTMLMAAFERPGIYAVTVSEAGYLDFVIKDVEVTAGVCHVNTVTVEARLSSI